MSQIVKQGEALPLSIGSIYAPIESELAQVELLLREELHSEHEFVDRMVQHGCLLGGKRLRPALLLLAAKATGQVKRDHIVLATVVEMIHTATLIHDDVLDEAEIRRHSDTVNARWNNEASVLLGDYLFTHSFFLASELESTMACRMIGRTTNIVCEGELRQIGSRADYQLSELDYLSIIESKTAELCSCCCYLGAHFAGADQQIIESLANFGRDLGIAFQIADDLLDILGDEASMGKSLGTDLDKQKPTLPVIWALQSAAEDQRDDLEKILSSDASHRRQELLPWLERFQAMDYARDKAKWYAQRASQQLEQLADSPAVEVLRSLPEYVVMRSQ